MNVALTLCVLNGQEITVVLQYNELIIKDLLVCCEEELLCVVFLDWFVATKNFISDLVGQCLETCSGSFIGTHSNNDHPKLQCDSVWNFLFIL